MWERAAASTRPGPRRPRRISLAGVIPALNQVVMHIDRTGPRQLQIDVVVLALAAMAGRDHRVRIEVDPADEGDLSGLAGVDQPALLMLGIARRRLVPADGDAGRPPLQQGQMGGRSPERVCLQVLDVAMRAIEDQPHVDAPNRRALEHIQWRTPPVRHLERWPHEGDGRPNASLGALDGFADAAEGRLAVHKGVDEIAGPNRIGPGSHERNI